MVLFNRKCVKTGIFLAFCFVFVGFSQPKTGGYNGLLNGVKSWVLPNAPAPYNTRPDQAWHSVGSSPSGDIYISGHDHATNSMLYRLSQKDDTLRWVGDARTASQAVSNWLTGETCQKFHDRPIWFNGKDYVASLDRSTLDNAYMSTRGFHWYCYDSAQNTFSDLSVSEPGGIGAAHIQLISIQPDPKKNVMYGVSIPEVKVVSYDIAKKVTTMLGRPSQWTTPQYIYSDRVTWVDSRSRLYITAGNDRAQWNMGEPVNVFNHVWYYDPASGFGELTNFPLQGANAMECGGWNREHTKWYGSDDHGHLYCFNDSGPTWTYLGRPGFDINIKVWTLEVAPDGDKLYVGRCDNALGIWEFDLAAKTSRSVFSISECDATAGTRAFLTGYDSWDQAGNLYLAEFSMNDGNNVILTRFNPVKLKVVKGLLPELVEVTAAAGTGGSVVVTRTGATTAAIKVIYDVVGLGSAGEELKKIYGSVTIAAGSATADITVDKSQFAGVAGVSNVVFTAAFDGDNYLAGSARSVSLGADAIRNVPQGSTAGYKNLMQTIRNSSGIYVIRLTVAQPSLAQLNLYDLNGKLVKTLLNRQLASGSYDIPLNERTGSSISGQGIFIAKMTIGKESVYQKVRCF
jgi:hypothetical protein